MITIQHYGESVTILTPGDRGIKPGMTYEDTKPTSYFEPCNSGTITRKMWGGEWILMYRIAGTFGPQFLTPEIIELTGKIFHTKR